MKSGLGDSGEPLVEPNGEWDQVHKPVNRSIRVKQVGHIRRHHRNRHHYATQLGVTDPAHRVACKQLRCVERNHLVDDDAGKSSTGLETSLD